MTEIRSIHGLEMAERGKLVTGKMGYIPYLSMTKGEMRLALLLEQAKVYAAAFPENPEYRQGVSLISNALNQGVSRGVSFVGALDGRFLQSVAAEISRSSKMQQPATRAGILGRDSIGSGIHIGDPIIPVVDRLKTCLKNAGSSPAKVMACMQKARIEEILNSGVVTCGHHMLYKDLRTNDNLPSTVSTKRIFHRSGVEGLAVTGELDPSLMYTWVETAILKKNATGNVGPIGSRETSFVLGKREAIGEPISITVLAIATLVSAALGGAAALLKSLRSEKAYAMAEAKGFGTEAVSPETDDWTGSGAGPGKSDNNFLLIGGLLAAYLLTEN